MNGKSFGQPHPYAMVLIAGLIAFAIGIATRLVAPESLADRFYVIQWLHVLTVVVLLVAAFKMFDSAARLFTSRIGRSGLVRVVVRLCGIMPALVGVLLLALHVLVVGSAIPPPAWDRRLLLHGMEGHVLPQNVEGRYADFLQAYHRSTRLHHLQYVVTMGLIALLIAYLVAGNCEEPPFETVSRLLMLKLANV